MPVFAIGAAVTAGMIATSGGGQKTSTTTIANPEPAPAPLAPVYLGPTTSSAPLAKDQPTATNDAAIEELRNKRRLAQQSQNSLFNLNNSIGNSQSLNTNLFGT